MNVVLQPHICILSSHQIICGEHDVLLHEIEMEMKIKTEVRFIEAS